MDTITAQLLAEVAMSSSAKSNSLSVLFKEFSKGNGATQEVINQIEALKGMRCKIKGTSYTGTIEGANFSKGGIYGGDRYPVLVRIDKLINGQEGVVFEYSLDQVIIDQ